MTTELDTIIERTRAKVATLPDPAPPAARFNHALTNPETERQAFQRYRRDQEMVERMERKRDALRHTPRWDVAMLDMWLHRSVRTYEMTTTFLLVHLMGPVARPVRDARAAYCVNCTYRKRRESPNLKAVPVEPGTPLSWKDRCHGPGNGKPCDCPDDLVWFPHALPWLLWLAGFSCPIGHWEKGPFAPAEPPQFIELTVNNQGGCGCG